MRWGSPEYIHLLWLLPLFIALFALFGRQARIRLSRFAPADLARRLITGRGRAGVGFKFAVFLAAVALLAVALARPQWGEKRVQAKRSGVDVMVALDTSYSMAAEDIPPNRLAKAKKEVEKLALALGGNRVGLLVFAGESAVECPLTTDVSTLRMFLAAVGYNAVSRGGTDISGAIRKSVAALQSSRAKSKIIVLVTDGGDNEGDPLDEAKKAAAQGVKIYTVGIGSGSGSPIPIRDEDGKLVGYKKDKSGQMVFTKLDDTILRAMAEETGGLFVSSSTGGLDISPVIESIEAQEKSAIGEAKFTMYEERFQIPLTVALLLLVVEWLI